MKLFSVSIRILETLGFQLEYGSNRSSFLAKFKIYYIWIGFFGLFCFTIFQISSNFRKFEDAIEPLPLITIGIGILAKSIGFYGMRETIRDLIGDIKDTVEKGMANSIFVEKFSHTRFLESNFRVERIKRRSFFLFIGLLLFGFGAGLTQIITALISTLFGSSKKLPMTLS